MEINDATDLIIGSAIEVHKELGPGLVESVYQRCLYHELECCGIAVRKEVVMPLAYKGIRLDHVYRLDLLVDNQIVLELKVVEKLNPVHAAQLLSYLRMGGYPLGVLINFNVTLLKQGIKRIINTPL